MDIDLPCIHLLTLEKPPEIPEVPKFNINFENQWKNLIVKFIPIVDKSPIRTIADQDKLYAKNTIKFYRKYKGEEIDDFVEKNYADYAHVDGFILNRPTFLFKLRVRIDEIQSNYEPGYINIIPKEIYIEGFLLINV